MPRLAHRTGARALRVSSLTSSSTLRFLPQIFVLSCLLGWSTSASGQWQCVGDVDSLRILGSTGAVLYAGNSITQIDLLSDEVARVRFRGGRRILEPDYSWAVIGRFEAPSSEAARTDSMLTLATSSLVVQVSLHPLRIRFSDRKGHMFCDDSRNGMGWSETEVRVWKMMPPDEHYLGFGEKAGKFDRRGTAMTMWNSDIPAYTADTDPLYQSIPFFYALRPGFSYGVFLDNAFRSFFDMGKASRDEYSFGAENGTLNYYVFTGPDPEAIIAEFTHLVGRMPLPPRWSLGYQQCRWSYTPAARVRQIARTFRTLRIPCDVIYLDIDYMDGYRVFTWNPRTFADPRGLLASLRSDGFKTVVIIDPGIKVDTNYLPFRTGVQGDHFVRDSEGSLFFGDVWPGRCAFPDFSNGSSRHWWGDQFAGLIADGVCGWWNDMNEPSVFNTPSKTIALNALHRPDFGPPEHAALHNVYGLEMTRATYEGVRRLSPNERPFILTRASFAGGQRYAAAWTGDNLATWEHLRLALTMCLNLSISGQPFVGSDIGGFFGTPSGELFARWLQLGVFTPLMRAHSAIHERNKEPWEYGEKFTAINRQTIELRYRLLPALYAVMEEASRTGLPAMRPLAFTRPTGRMPNLSDDEFFFGPDLLVAPVLTEGATRRSVSLPSGDWYDFWTGKRTRGDTTITVRAPIERIPFFVRGGSFLATQDVEQYSDQKPAGRAILMVYPPVAGSEGSGHTYEDDGTTFRYGSGEFRRRELHQRWSQNELLITLGACEGSYHTPNRTLLLQIAGDRRPREVRVNDRPAEERTLVTVAGRSPVWAFDRKERALRICLPDRTEKVTAVIRY
jgi:alpha-glucosidase